MKLSPLFKKILPYLILSVFGFLLYYQTMSFSFVYLDDNRLILDNQEILRESSFIKIFTSDVFFSNIDSSFYYRPLLNISFLLDIIIGKTAPFIFHFSNLILHLLSVSLLFYIFKKHFFSEKISLFLSFVFLTHPALAQAVAWIPGRNDLLLTIFVLISFSLFLDFLKNNKLSYLWWHFIFLLFALFTKETAVFLPIICVFYYYLFDEKSQNDYRKDNYLIIGAGWITSFIIWFLFRKVSLSAEMSLDGLFISGIQNFSAAVIYLGKVILPVNLSVYPIIKDSTYFFGILSAIFIFTGIYFSQKLNWRRLAFGFLWFIIFLLPSFLNPDPSSTSSFFEHRLYLPIIGLFICIAEIYPLKDVKWQTKKSVIIAVSIIVIFSGLTFFHSRHFSDRLTFWVEAVKNSPSSAFAHNNLGAMYYLDNNLEGAKTHYLEALKIDSQQRLSNNNLGLIAMNQGKVEEAEVYYKKELEFNPYYDNAWSNLGILYFKEKRFEEAANAFKTAYQINPNNQTAYSNLLILNAN